MTTKTKARSQNHNGPQFPPQIHAPTIPSYSDAIDEASEQSLEDFESAPSAVTEMAPDSSDPLEDQAAGAEDVAGAKHPVVTKPEFCLILVRDGGWPVLEICGDVESLTKRMRALEGEHVSVLPFFGIPVPYTKGPGRFLQLPDGQPYPVFDCSEIGTFVPKPMATLPIDMSYFLGPDMGSNSNEEPTVIDYRPVGAT
jgi:hypothetical protein